MALLRLDLHCGISSLVVWYPTRVIGTAKMHNFEISVLVLTYAPKFTVAVYVTNAELSAHSAVMLQCFISTKDCHTSGSFLFNDKN